jgi:hypothetical protein
MTWQDTQGMSPRKKMFLSAAAFALISVGILGWHEISKSRIVAFSENEITPTRLPHHPTSLKVHGVSFSNLRGEPPFYLPLSNLDCILFVTATNENRSIIHIFDLTTDTQELIPLIGFVASFGRSINSHNRESVDSVLGATTSNIVLRSIAPNVETEFEVNPATKTCTLLYATNLAGVYTKAMRWIPSHR